MCIHEGHVVFEPLRAVHERRHAGTRVEVLDLHDGFVAAGVAEGVVVHLHKPVDVVDIPFRVLHPVDVVQAPLLEVSRLVVGHEVPQRRGLLVVFRVLNGFVQPFDDLGNAFAVEAVQLVDVFKHLSFSVLFETAVQPILHGAAVFFVRNGLEVRLGLLRGHVGCVEVHGRTFHKAFGAVLFHLLGFHRRVKHDAAQFSVQRVPCLGKQVVHVRFTETRLVLGVGVVVMDAVGEPDALEVHLKFLPTDGVAVPFVVDVDVLEEAANAKVVAVVLVVHDVASAQTGHVQTVHQGLLLGAQLLPSWDLVADEFQVGELLGLPHKPVFVWGTCSGLRRRGCFKIRPFRGRSSTAGEEQGRGQCGASQA